ncbi:MAG TPA: hypothetical protein VFN67_07340 [Polyangiales bacterium]|nr:hypothetical protein [Polyangiales bacterium]
MQPPRGGRGGIGSDSRPSDSAGSGGGSAVDPEKKPDSRPGKVDSNTGGKGGAPAASGGSGSQQQAGAGGAAGEPSTEPSDGAAGHDNQTDAGVDAGGGGEPAPEQGGTGGTGGSGGDQAGTGGEESLPPTSEPDATLTYLSDSDRSSDVRLSSDRLSAEWLGLANLGVRSTRAVAPRAGVFYFEAYADLDLFNLGVATKSAPLDQGAGQTGGFGIDTSGVIDQEHAESQPFQRSAHGEYGFVVDYRTEHPTVYLIAGSSEQARVAGSRTLSTISEPLYIHLSGLRRQQGYQATINPGNDTTNRPFVLDVRGALQSSGHADVATALVLGWGGTHTGTWNEPPKLTVGSAPSQVDVGTAVTLTASATDAEGGVGAAQIVWDVLSLGIAAPEHEHGTGGSFTFTPRTVGHHPVRVSVTDAGGKRVERVVTIEARGTLEQFSSVKLVKEPEFTSSSIQLSSDGLRAHWTEDHKNAVRANQGLYGDFWYVEGHRLVPEDNQAIGLVIGGVSLDPYEFDITPPSCSINTTGPSVFHNLMYAQSQAPTNVEYYGFAVDYRGDYPIVYVVIGGVLATVLHLTDVTVPIYPMLYGNINGHGAAYDMEINFGGSTFHENPVAVLKAAGISTSGLKLCWGNSNSACP